MRSTLTPVGDTGLRIERVFDATPHELWAVMTDPAGIPDWWGPAHHDPTVIEMDMRVGGRWRFELAGNNDAVFGFSGEYLEIDAPHRMVQTFVFDPFPDAGVTETATLEDLGDGRTLFRVDIEHPTPEGRDAQVMNGMEAGMQETHNRLQALVAARRSS